ncbi:MAG: TonB-dependent receptor [Gammaproteobacteria bacterium]|nr:TonB-dependent receptor [Gammaproteobacteria bacterium]NNM13039.1 TonB-dependent receptor [Gammaproteobacteria bacterium]
MNISIKTPGRSVLLLCIVVLFSFSVVYAQDGTHEEHTEHHNIEEVVVTGVLNKSQKETVAPIAVLDQEALRENAASTIGDMLKSQVGVNSVSFGPGVGQPVIRGHGANRVQVLQNGSGALDASNTSQDHANAIEGMLAERIEIVRGPSTLLYGNGAIGGVVNVIDKRIRSDLPESTSGALEFRKNDVNNGNTGVAMLSGAAGNFAWHVDGVLHSNDNVSIPGFALKDSAEMSSFGILENSDSEKRVYGAGLTFIADAGYIGLSINDIDNQYGLPPGAHEHEESHADEDEEFTRLDMQQTRVDLKAEYSPLSSWVNKYSASLTLNDYMHSELEGEEIGTVYDNQGQELRVNAHHQGVSTDLNGSLGLHYVNRDFVAKGEEVFIPEANINALGIYLIESLTLDKLTFEGGIRLDQQRIDINSHCDPRHNSISSNLGLIWNVNSQGSLHFSISRSQRAPAVEELFSNFQSTGCNPSSNLPNPDALVEHAATRRLEIGDPGLQKETSLNYEIGYRHHQGRITGEATTYINAIDDYIYLSDIADFDDAIISRYLQEDARFIGAEADIDVLLFETGRGNKVNFSIFGEYVAAELLRGPYVPRIPPQRSGIELSFTGQDWSVKVRDTLVYSQKKLAARESKHYSYKRIDVYADYHWHVGDKQFQFFANGRNLSNEEIRNHASFTKEFAPEPGRSIELGVRYVF